MTGELVSQNCSTYVHMSACVYGFVLCVSVLHSDGPVTCPGCAQHLAPKPAFPLNEVIVSVASYEYNCNEQCRRGEAGRGQKQATAPKKLVE